MRTGNSLWATPNTTWDHYPHDPSLVPTVKNRSRRTAQILKVKDPNVSHTADLRLTLPDCV